MNYMKAVLASVVAFLCFISVLSADSSLNQDPWVVRMTLPARLKLEKSITEGDFDYTSLRVSSGHGQKRDNGLEYWMAIETVSVGGKSKTQIRDMEKITLFGKDVWVNDDTKEKLQRSILDLVYIYSNDGVIQSENLVLVESKPIDNISTKSKKANARPSELISSETLSLSFDSASKKFILSEVIADLFGFQVEYENYTDSDIGLNLRNVTWMEAFDLILYKSGYHWGIVEGKVRVKKGEVDLDVRKIDPEDQAILSSKKKQGKDFEFKDTVFSKVVNEVADEYDIDYIMNDPQKADVLDLYASSGNLYQLFEKLCTNFNYSIKIADEDVLILERNQK